MRTLFKNRVLGVLQSATDLFSKILDLDFASLIKLCHRKRSELQLANNFIYFGLIKFSYPLHTPKEKRINWSKNPF